MNDEIEYMMIIISFIVSLMWTIPLTFYLSVNYLFPDYLYFALGVLGYLITKKLMF